MVSEDEDALICDFAETYGIYDYKRLPLRKAAIFASGLRDDSRIKMKMSGLNVTLENILNAAIADRTGLIAWMQSEDGAKNRKRPESILEKILNPGKEKEGVVAFENAQEFEAERNRIIGKERQ